MASEGRASGLVSWPRPLIALWPLPQLLNHSEPWSLRLSNGNDDTYFVVGVKVNIETVTS